MDILKVMQWLWLTSSMKQKLINMGIPAKELEGIDFNNMNSLNQLWAKIMPWQLKKNPQLVKRMKESWWLDSQTQQEVNNVIDWL
jgi:hypothetical protein